MSVYQVEEYYVFIQFKEKLSKKQRVEVLDFLDFKEVDNENLSDEGITVHDFFDEVEADEFYIQFRSKFSNLIK